MTASSGLFSGLQPIATRGKKARGTLLVDKHCRNGCSIKRAPLSVITTKLAAAILGVLLFGGGALPAQYYPCGFSGDRQC